MLIIAHKLKEFLVAEPLSIVSAGDELFFQQLRAGQPEIFCSIRLMISDVTYLELLCIIQMTSANIICKCVYSNLLLEFLNRYHFLQNISKSLKDVQGGSIPLQTILSFDTEWS